MQINNHQSGDWFGYKHAWGDEKYTQSSHQETEGNIPSGKPRPPCIDGL